MNFSGGVKKNLVLLTAASFLSFLLLEAGYRVVLFGPESLSPAIMSSIHTIDEELIRASSVPEAVWELKPFLNILFKKARLKTNSQGLRDQEYSIVKPEGVFRIAVVGDSMTLPDGVAIEDAFHSILETRLNSQSRGKKYELINFAVGGYNLRQYAAVIEKKIALYQPDLVLIGFCPENDFSPYPEKIFNQRYQPRRVRYPWFYLYVFEKMGEIFQGRFISPDYAQKKNIRLESAGLSVENQSYVQGLLKRVQVFSAKTRIPIVIINIDNHPTPEAYVRFLERETAAFGLYFLDLSAFFSLKELPRYRLYRADLHPNKAAHRVFAERLFDFLIGHKLG